MGFFSFNYTKPGPGVSKEAPKKKGVFLYFELLGRKFFKLLQTTLLCSVFSIPYIVVMFLFVTGLLGGYFLEFFKNYVPEEFISQIMIWTNGIITMLIYSLWGSGPASAGFAYITRCFTREEHAWILTDFLKKFKENFKQSMILVVMDFVLLFLITNAVIQYWNLYSAQNQFIWLLMMYVCVMVFTIYTFMHIHIYQIMVTYECKFVDLIKNSLLLALGKAPLNLILSALSVIITGIVFFYCPHPLLSVLISACLLFGHVRYPFEFYSARTIEKIMNNTSEGK